MRSGAECAAIALEDETAQGIEDPPMMVHDVMVRVSGVPPCRCDHASADANGIRPTARIHSSAVNVCAWVSLPSLLSVEHR
jgi:hypothetical protein